MDKLHSKLGKKLSSRYLGSDAFTSSAGRFGGRTVSRLGSILKKGTSKKYYGVGQRVGLFEFKNIVLKILVVIILITALAYTIPVTRYATHRFFTKTFALSGSVTQSSDILAVDEAFVAPQIFKTDAFVGRQDDNLSVVPGTLVYDTENDALIGTVSETSSSSFEVVLFSDSGYKGNFFTMNESFIDISKAQLTTEEELSLGTTSSSTSSTTTRKAGTQAIAFEGVGYGQMLAKIPPQTKIENGTQIFAATPHGLKAVAEISHIEPDKGSAFTLVYAQLLVPPTHIYKVRLSPLEN